MKVKTAMSTKQNRFTDFLAPARRFIDWAGSIGFKPDDSAETRSHKTILTIALYVAVSNLLLFVPVYFAIHRVPAALTLLGFAIFLTINLAWFHHHRNFKIFRDVSFIAIYLYIIIYHTVMGGYIGSTGYINYGIAILNGVQMFYKRRKAKNTWFIVYVLTAIILYFLEPVISTISAPLPDSLNTIMFVNNFILIAGMVMLSGNYFISIIRKEKLKSDLLIRNILPEAVVNELNQYGKSNPIKVPLATAIFIDFVGFTKISQKMLAEEIVDMLNIHFTKFDEIFRGHHVEKLKTIGDGYMAVGGLPESNNTHPLDVALAAMKVISYIEEFNTSKQKNFDVNIRIGIHIGPMVAGIIGESKFSYDVWGSSVNLCSRLETASKPGCINVSKEFMECTNTLFEFEARGLVEAKNMEPVPMYFLTDIKEPLRAAHFRPNNRFYEQYRLYTVNQRYKHQVM
jgi:class 3 adenylate cyclase